MTIKITLLVVLASIFARVNGQLTPQQAAAGMVRGINIGNTMEAPDGETTWGNIAVQQRAFSDYKNAGFTAIRIPITWNKRTSTTSPYAITAAWMDRVEQVVDWGLKQKLIIVINAHHEDWLKGTYTATNIARFDSIWSQIAIRFKNKSDSLIFEIINEPYPLSQSNTNTLNLRILNIIRKSNPTRIVSFSGHNWSGANDLISCTIPNVNDPYIMGYYHSYDPYPFGLEGTGSYGTDADMAATKQQFDDVKSWWDTKNIPVFLGEYGAMRDCEYNSRMACYGSVVYEALAHNMPAFAWDDNGYFPIYNRILGTFNEIKDIIIYTQLESPYKFIYTGIPGKKFIKLNWVNRVLTDSIVIERSANGATGFTRIAKIAPESVQYIDSTVIAGNVYYYRLRTSVPGKIVLSCPLRTAKICDPIALSPYFQNGTGLMQQSSKVDLRVGDTVKLSPQAASGSGTWSWAGPNSFTSSSREITVSNIQKAGAGNYAATYTLMTGCPNTSTFVITVCEPVAVTPYLQLAGKSQVQDTIASVNAGSGVKLTPVAAATGGTWSWIGPNGFTSSGSSVILTGIQEPKTGIYQVSYTVTPVCVTKCNYVVQLAGTTGISQLETKELIIFPNPTDGVFNIKCSGKGVVQVFNVIGEMVFESKVVENKWIATILPKGIYVLRYTDSYSTFLKRLIVR
jgi:hypothetical protein